MGCIGGMFMLVIICVVVIIVLGGIVFVVRIGGGVCCEVCYGIGDIYTRSPLLHFLVRCVWTIYLLTDFLKAISRRLGLK